MIVGLRGETQAIVTTGVSIGAPIGLAVAGASFAIPFVGAAIAGVTLLIGVFTKKGKQKTASTHIVDQVEPYMKQNLAAWNSSDKTLAEQQQCLANFDALWQQVVQACSDPNLGDPGHACIDDRKSGGKWDWFAYYRDPIANDPNVKANIPQSISSVLGGNASPDTLILLGGVVLLVYLISQ